MPDSIAPYLAGQTAAPPRWPSRLLLAAVLAGMATLLGLAWLWLARNPLLSFWDEVMHLNISMQDALVLKEGGLAALRDRLMLQERWLPPGLRLLGLPVAIAFGTEAPSALRIFAAVATTATALVIWAGLRPVAGRTGAAAGALLYVLTPQNLLGAQSFMTEIPLHLAAACAMALLLHEAVAPRASMWRLGLLGLALGLGALAKLTFLPSIGLAWVGLALWRWWRDRDPAAFRLRILLPAVGLAALAWPFYLLNGGRYVGYAKATAAGYGFIPVEETGLAYAMRVGGTLLWEVLGLGGAPLLVAAVVLGLMGWRRLGQGQRSMILLAILAATPAFIAFLFSKNQTERYLGISLVALCTPVGLAIGAAMRDAALTRLARGAVVVVAAAAFLQIGAAWVVALGGPLPGRPLRPMVEANWRPNTLCDLTPVADLLPPRGDGDRTRVGVFALTPAVNPNTVLNAYLRQGRSAHVIELVNDSATSINWDRLLAESAQLDLIILPEVFWQHGTDPSKVPGERNVADRSIDEYRARLGDRVVDRGTIRNGTAEACTAHVLTLRQDTPEAEAARARPLRPEAH
ncbi:glycosyltransferase family 39 protein [Belnapia sp. T6]|uniref:Glycosyltransferase family 39 protein n=1 Tax=Belnapia mucosa TaxID=2804532 RepID=A0ABS1V064_9PROT|nr:glycosyltransferase family 39 protein [Belnapia mucosa]MBL6455086.1 glycosyltransferase family 39 protein [Belnapia mucosa]